MTPTEVAIVSALGASFLTGFASLGVMWLQQLLQGRSADRAALAASAQKLLSHSMAVATRARTMADTMKFRSGLKEGFDVAMRHRKPVDSMELHDWIAQDVAPMNEALTEIWTRDDQDGVRLANDVASKCADLLGTSGARQPAEGFERVKVWAAGEKWTTEMVQAYDDAVLALMRARKDYANHVRAKLKLDDIELFTHADADWTQKAIEQGTRS